MGEAWQEFEFLDHPSVTSSIFYPRSDYYKIPDSDRVMGVDLPVEPGLSISCQFYFLDRGYPNVLYFHGNGELATEYEETGLLYNEAGVNLFVADFRGYGRSGGRPTVTGMLKDSHRVLEGFSRTMAIGGFTGGQFIMGRSLGSASAIELAASHPDAFKGLIVESGFCDVSDLLLSLGATGMQSLQSPGLERVRKIRIPALIIHGEYDSIVPLAQGEKIYDNLGSAEKRMVIIPNADHNTIFMEGMQLYMQGLVDFVGRHK